MKRLSSAAFREQFLKHVGNFLETVSSGRELASGHVVAVSGGRDSMALLRVAQEFLRQKKIGSLRAVFVHHHTRPGQDEDQRVVETFCQKERIPLTVLHTQSLAGTRSNFEDRARKERRRLLLSSLGQNECLWLGHHINDSYEWAIMQRNRTSALIPTLGIPVRNGKIIRPFMSVSRKQIENFVRFERLPFSEDPTNQDLQFDRNYFRHEVVANIEKRFPKYLKHYVNIANQTALNLNKSIIARRTLVDVYSYEDGAVLVGMKFDVVQIQELMHAYSRADRGELVGPIGRMLSAIQNGKKGPFQFSGGLEAYHSHNLLMIYQKGMKNSDESISRVLKTLSHDTLEKLATYAPEELENSFANFLKSPHAMCDMPGLILVLEGQNVCKTLNCSVFDSRFPLVSKVCQEKGLRFITYTKCLERWRSRRKNLPEKLRLLPLNNLTHLFSSQQ